MRQVLQAPAVESEKPRPLQSLPSMNSPELQLLQLAQVSSKVAFPALSVSQSFRKKKNKNQENEEEVPAQVLLVLYCPARHEEVFLHEAHPHSILLDVEFQVLTMY